MVKSALARVALGLLCLAAKSAAAADRTYLVHVHAFCAGSSCEPESAEYEKLLQKRFLKINAYWKPVGISFLPFLSVHLNSEYAAINNEEGESNTPGVSNEELVAAIEQQYADAEPYLISMFLFPDMPQCGAGPNMTVECSFGGSAKTLAHELGHHFCLNHTFTHDDSASSYPDPVDHDGDNIADTPPDPGKHTEGSSEEDDDIINGIALPGHEWCETTVHDTGYGDTFLNDTYCTVGCFQSLPTGGVIPADYAPLTENIMSYYGGDCKGPYLLDGFKHEAFTPGQAARIGFCIETHPSKADLIDICEYEGGDTDSDGLCDDYDPCPEMATLDIGEDLDDDGIPNICDPCIDVPGVGVDTDDDGVCNENDPDDDNDGCDDFDDKEPLNHLMVAGVNFGEGCHELVYGLAGEDTDGDGYLNCYEGEPDSDGDGFPDVQDTCPLSRGLDCIQYVGCPQPTVWWTTCAPGGCDMYLVRLIAAVNPDPTRAIYFEEIEIVNRALYLPPLQGLAASETAMLLAGRGMLDPTLPNPLSGAGRLRLELVSYQTGRPVAVIAEYEPHELRLGALGAGAALAFTPGSSREAPAVDVVWVAGATVDAALLDSDGDWTPEPFDNCPLVYGSSQSDDDGDRVGDLCDDDFVPPGPGAAYD
jgi:hypothetical protein